MLASGPPKLIPLGGCALPRIHPIRGKTVAPDDATSHVWRIAAPAALAVITTRHIQRLRQDVRRGARGARGARGTSTRATASVEGERAESDMDSMDSMESMDSGVSDTPYEELYPPAQALEKWIDGQKYILVKYGKVPEWVPETDVGTYRFSKRGYESRDPDGNWVCHAQMPEDTSHLTDAQRERLILELRGQISFNLSDGIDEDGFRPLPKVPPLEKWPFYRVDITDDVKAQKEQLDDFQQLQLTEDLPRAYFLANRWKTANEARRHLGYGVNTTINDVANMNGTVLGFKALVEQLKRTSKFRRRKDDDPMPSDADRLQKLQCTSLLGTDKGSAISLWFYNSKRKKLMIDLCLGDDCMDQGLYAEEILLRCLISQGHEMGAETVWCRSRRTESGKVFLPPSMRNLGFTAVPIEEQEEEEWESLGVVEQKEEATEAVPGLKLWMTTRDLEDFLAAANDWCEEMGATDLNEVADNKYDLADFLEEKGLTSEQRLKLVQY